MPVHAARSRSARRRDDQGGTDLRPAAKGANENPHVQCSGAKTDAARPPGLLSSPIRNCRLAGLQVATCDPGRQIELCWTGLTFALHRKAQECDGADQDSDDDKNNQLTVRRARGMATTISHLDLLEIGDLVVARTSLHVGRNCTAVSQPLDSQREHCGIGDSGCTKPGIGFLSKRRNAGSSLQVVCLPACSRRNALKCRIAICFRPVSA